MKEIKTFSADETAAIGARLGKTLKRGDIVCITGELGTGKTVFTKGIAVSLGIKGHVTSPSFTIVNEYNSDIPLYHFDMYRINDTEDIYDIGFDEYIDGRGITIIEWADLIRELLPHDCIWVNIRKDERMGTDTRIISFDLKGTKG